MRSPNEADKFIQSIEALAEDAERGAAHAAREAGEYSHPNDVAYCRREAEELGYIAAKLRALAGQLTSRIVFGVAGKEAA